MAPRRMRSSRHIVQGKMETDRWDAIGSIGCHDANVESRQSAEMSTLDLSFTGVGSRRLLGLMLHQVASTALQSALNLGCGRSSDIGNSIEADPVPVPAH